MLIPDTVVTPDRWRSVSAALTTFVNSKLGATGVTVKILDTDYDKDARFGKDTPAAWYTPKTNDVVLNVRKIPHCARLLSDPSGLVGQLSSPYYWRGSKDPFAIASGMLAHEIGHSKVSTFITEPWYAALTRHERAVLISLEEIRAEKHMADKRRRLSWIRKALRSCAQTLFPTKKDFEEAKDARGRIDLFQWSCSAILLIGRANIKIVNWYEVREYYEFTEDLLGWERVETMLDICEEYMNLEYVDAVKMTDLAKEWVELFRDESEDGEAGEGEGMEMVDLPGLMDMIGEILDAMGKSIDAWLDNESDTHSPDMPASSEVDGKVIAEAEEKLMEAASKRVEHGFSRGTHGDKRSRKPKPEEKAAAQRLGKRLEKLSAPEKVTTTTRSVAPPGRLKSGAAVAQAADRAQGRASSAKPWEGRHRRYIENPPITVGIMTDVSGSQGWATEFSASSAWIVNRATQHVNGKAAAVTFGEKAEVTAFPGKVGDVIVRQACDGSEAFNDGLATLDYLLKLEAGKGTRILFVVTDGFLVAEGEMEACAKWIVKMRKAGVHVIWVTPSEKSETYRGLPVIPKGVTVMKVNPHAARATELVGEMAKTIEKAVATRGRV